MFARFQFHTRSIESFNLFHFTSIFTHKTTQSCTENRSNLQWKNLAGDQLFFKTMIENSYNFRKHSFGTSLLARELSGTGRLRDPGPGVWGIRDQASEGSGIWDPGPGVWGIWDPGPRVWGIRDRASEGSVSNYESTSDAWIHRVFSMRRTRRGVTIKAL